VQLQQLTLNLILNGLEAMDEVNDRARSLSISSEVVSDGVRIQVRDCGVGLKDPKKIFEPFFTTKQSGMGMGLAICRTVVEAHGGRIWATDQEGPGTTLCFTLPVVLPSGLESETK
jgi:signal transduction histidine kinase